MPQANRSRAHHVLAAALIGLAAPVVSWSLARHPISWRVATQCAAGAAAAGYCVVLARRHRRAELRRERQHAEEMARLYLSVIEALALAIDSKDRSAERRLRRLQTFAVDLGESLGLKGQELEALRAGALLHDIGKIAVPEYILGKPGRLSPDEFAKMSVHPRVGAEILERVRFPYPVAAVVRAHHERWDGSGYPDGLRGHRIPLAARILSVVDCYDALISDRPYRRALTRDAALAHLTREAGVSFDPEVVRLLVSRIDRLEGLEGPSAGGAVAAEPGPAAPQSFETGASAALKTLDPSTHETITKTPRETWGLYALARGMARAQSVSEALTHLSATLTPLAHHRFLVVWLLDEDRRVLRVHRASGPDTARLVRWEIPVGERTAGRAAAERRTIADPGPHDFAEIMKRGQAPRVPRALALPLLDGDRLFGVLGLYDAEERPYSDADARRLEVVVPQISEVVHHALLFERTQENALTDPLTRLPNARFLFGSFDQEMRRAEVHGASLSLVEIDINDFKAINDRYGHPAGDRVLRGVARAIRSQLRPGDTCVRYAGDEFIVTIPGVGADAIQAVVERIAAAVARRKFAVARGSAVAVGISAGSASFPADGRSYDELIAVADARMYREKFARRGQPPVMSARTRFAGRDDVPVN